LKEMPVMEENNNTHIPIIIPLLGVSTSLCSHIFTALLIRYYNYVFICLLLPVDFSTSRWENTSTSSVSFISGHRWKPRKI
jgi:O-antigen/teichoic acid export membrane protein